jgi:uncharacterized Zn finger protein (UPF0148 family)
VESAYKLRPATEGQLDELRSLQHEPIRTLTCGEAAALIESIKARNQRRREVEATPVFIPQTSQPQSSAAAPAAMVCSQCHKSKTVEHNGRQWCPTCGTFVTAYKPQAADENLTAEKFDWRTAPASEKQKEKLRLLGCKFDDNITVGVVKLLIERQKAETETSQPSVRHEGYFGGTYNPQVADEKNAPIINEPEPPFYLKYSFDPYIPVEFKQTVAENRRRYARYVSEMERWNSQRKDGAVKQPEPFPEPPNQPGPPAVADQMPEQKNTASKWSSLFEARKQTEEVTIQEAAKPQKSNPIYIIPGREVQGCADQTAHAAAKFISSKLEPHLKGLKSQDKYVRKIAAVALGRSKDPQAVKPLISCLADSDWGVRMQAVQSLSDLGFPEAIAAVIESLKDAEPYIRKTACDALGQIKNIGAVDALLGLVLDEPKEWVRQAAAQALARIQGKTPAFATAADCSHDRYAALEPVKDAVSAFAGQKVEPLLKTCASADDCYWLPMAKAATLAQVSPETKFTIGQSRQIAHKIQWAGYCVEPDARFGGGTYDWHQTIGVFKSCDNDSTEPSSAYLGAANLLRLSRNDSA